MYAQLVPIYISLGLLSFILSCTINLVYWSSPKMRRDHASTIINTITICNMLYTSKYLVTAFFWLIGLRDGSRSFHIIPDHCLTSSAFGQFVGMAATSWNACWTYDFLCVLVNPLRNTATQRRWYHLWTWVLSIVTTIALITAVGHRSAEPHTCWIKGNTEYSLIFEIPLFLYSLLAFVSLVYAIYRLRFGSFDSGEHRKSILITHALYVILFIALWTWPVIRAFMKIPHSPIWDRVDAIFVSSQAGVMALVRLTDATAKRTLVRLLQAGLHRVTRICIRYKDYSYGNYSHRELLLEHAEEKLTPKLKYFFCCSCRRGPSSSLQRTASERSFRGSITKDISIYGSVMGSASPHIEMEGTLSPHPHGIQKDPPSVLRPSLDSPAILTRPLPRPMHSKSSNDLRPISAFASSNKNSQPPLLTAPREANAGWDVANPLRTEMGLCMLSALCSAAQFSPISDRTAHSYTPPAPRFPVSDAQFSPVSQSLPHTQGGAFVASPPIPDSRRDANSWLKDPTTHCFSVETDLGRFRQPPKPSPAGKSAPGTTSLTSSSIASPLFSPGNGDLSTSSMRLDTSSTAAKSDTSVPHVQLEVTSFAHEAFAALRSNCGIEPVHILQNLHPCLLRSNEIQGRFSGGASASFFCQSKDESLVVKTLSTQELEVLLRLLPAYIRHLQLNPHSLLVKFYGCFGMRIISSSSMSDLSKEEFVTLPTIGSVLSPFIPANARSLSRVYFILMNNVFPFPSPGCFHTTFDLKGSTVNRRLLIAPEASAQWTAPFPERTTTPVPPMSPQDDPDVHGVTPGITPRFGMSVANRARVAPQLQLTSYRDLDFRDLFLWGLPIAHVPPYPVTAPLDADNPTPLPERIPHSPGMYSAVPQSMQEAELFKSDMLAQLQMDVTLLASQGLMDYSLLLRVTPVQDFISAAFDSLLDSPWDFDNPDIHALSLPHALELLQSLHETSTVRISPLTRSLPQHSKFSAFLCTNTAASTFQFDQSTSSPAAKHTSSHLSLFRDNYPTVLVQIGIVDVLQLYTTSKRVESALKLIRYGSLNVNSGGLSSFGDSGIQADISAVDPHRYAVRFSGFMSEIFSSPKPRQ